MGWKTRVLLTAIEIGAMLAIKIYATKLIQKIRPAGSRVRQLPDGTPVVRLDNPAYYDELPHGEITNAAYLPGSESALDKGLRTKARQILRWWELSRRHVFHKSYRRSQEFTRLRRCVGKPLDVRTLPLDQQLDRANRKPEPGETE